MQLIYMDHICKKRKNIISKIPDFDILSEDAKISSIIVKEQLEYERLKM